MRAGKLRWDKTARLRRRQRLFSIRALVRPSAGAGALSSPIISLP